ncbi:MAG: carbonic anhydrase [Firmicutes bacterium]|nr:carbonic anhydrase [Alicyclobacillaceae bacterium]MCL6498260.1 carbonic anhydrase [Bacillota bacterium]
MPTVKDEILQANAHYAQSFNLGSLPIPPSRHLAVVACMDARLHVEEILGLKPGDAHIIRNAGGVVTEDTIRSLAISQRLLGTRAIVLVHHTDCGMVTFRDDDLRDAIEREVGIRPPFTFEAFRDPAEDVRQSIRRIQASPFIPHKDAIYGFVYDVKSGQLTPIEQ